MGEIIASDLEQICITWLDAKKIPYQFQSSMAGGFYALGGSVIDFLFPERGLGWRIMGEYFHRTVEASGRDIIQKETLQAMGLTIVDIWGSDLEDPDRVNETLTKALQGVGMLQ